MLAPDHLFNIVKKRLASQGASTHVAAEPTMSIFSMNVYVPITHAT